MSDYRRDGDRAVSNTLGFVIIFSIVLFSLALVSTAGLSGLQDTRDATMSRNAELSMLDVASAIEDVHRKGETRRTAGMRLGRGRLQPGDQVTINVSITETGGGPVPGSPWSIPIDPIVYQLEKTMISYEGTAVVREQAEGASSVREPAMIFNDDGAIVPLVATDAPENPTAIGSSTAQVRLRRSGANVYVIDETNPVNVTIGVNTTDHRADVWHDVLSEKVNGGCDVGQETVTCTQTGVDGPVIVRKVDVGYQIQ